MKDTKNWMIIALAAALIATVSITSCRAPESGNSTIASNPSVLEKIKKEKVIRAGIVPYPPFVIKDPNTNEFSGYFVELMDEIAKFMGTEDQPVVIEYEETTWAGMVAGLKSGQFDIVVSGIFSTIPRGLEVTWPKPCMYVGMGALVKKDDDRFSNAEDLRVDGLKIAVAAGEVGHEYVQRFLPNADPIVLQTADTAATALEVSTGSADIALAESVALVKYAKEHPEVKAIFVDEPLFTYATSFMVRRNDPEFLDFMNQAIQFMQLAGVTDRLDAKYNPSGEIWVSPNPPFVGGNE